MKTYPDVEFLRSKFISDGQTGCIYRRVDGSRADCQSKDYRRVFINGGYYAAHRILWAMEHGEYPSAEMDHINGDKEDNRLSNLRPATKSQNAANRHQPRRKHHVGLPRGVTLFGSRFQAQICVNRKVHYLGLFQTPQEAADAYTKAALELHGEFARTA